MLISNHTQTGGIKQNLGTIGFLTGQIRQFPQAQNIADMQVRLADAKRQLRDLRDATVYIDPRNP